MNRNILIVLCSISYILSSIYNHYPLVYNNITYINNTNICNTKINDTKINDTNIFNTKINDTKINDTKINDTKINDTKINNSKINNSNINNSYINDTTIYISIIAYINTNINNTNICNDSNIYCSNWSKYNECIANPVYMLNYCKKSCDTCNINSFNIDKIIKIYSNMCIDLNNNCINWTMQGECQKNPNYMLARCKKSCKVC
jgi:hypothetical protein